MQKIKELFQNISLRQRVGNHFCYGIMQEFLSCLVKLRWQRRKRDSHATKKLIQILLVLYILESFLSLFHYLNGILQSREEMHENYFAVPCCNR